MTLSRRTILSMLGVGAVNPSALAGATAKAALMALGGSTTKTGRDASVFDFDDPFKNPSEENPLYAHARKIRNELERQISRHNIYRKREVAHVMLAHKYARKSWSDAFREHLIEKEEEERVMALRRLENMSAEQLIAAFGKWITADD